MGTSPLQAGQGEVGTGRCRSTEEFGEVLWASVKCEGVFLTVKTSHSPRVGVNGN